MQKSPSNIKPKPRLEILDALRGLAALAVALFHFSNGWEPNAFTTPCKWGFLGVEVFFVISGFIIPYSLARSNYAMRNDYGHFMLKRLVRIYPPYIASVALVILLWHLSAMSPAFRGEVTYTAGGAALHAVLLNDIAGVPWLQPVYWTLAIELQFYLLAGVITPLLIAGNRFRVVVLGTLLLVSLIPISTLRPNYCLLTPYLPLFILGILAFLHDQSKISTRSFLIGLVVVIVSGAWSLGWPQVVAGSLASLSIAFVRVSIPKPLIWLGTVSYSLYLLHIPLGGRVKNIITRFAPLDTIPTQIAFCAFALTLSLLAALLWYRFLEAPSQKWSSAIRYKLASKKQ